MPELDFRPFRLTALPRELRLAVAGHLERSDQLRLIRVSKWFHDDFLEVIYRNTASLPIRAIEKEPGILRNIKKCAPQIRSLILVYDPTPEENQAEVHGRLLLDILDGVAETPLHYFAIDVASDLNLEVLKKLAEFTRNQPGSGKIVISRPKRDIYPLYETDPPSTKNALLTLGRTTKTGMRLPNFDIVVSRAVTSCRMYQLSLVKYIISADRDRVKVIGAQFYRNFPTFGTHFYGEIDEMKLMWSKYFGLNLPIDMGKLAFFGYNLGGLAALTRLENLTSVTIDSCRSVPHQPQDDFFCQLAEAKRRTGKTQLDELVYGQFGTSGRFATTPNVPLRVVTTVTGLKSLVLHQNLLLDVSPAEIVRPHAQTLQLFSWRYKHQDMEMSSLRDVANSAPNLGNIGFNWEYATLPARPMNPSDTLEIFRQQAESLANALASFASLDTLCLFVGEQPGVALALPSVWFKTWERSLQVFITELHAAFLKADLSIKMLHTVRLDIAPLTEEMPRSENCNEKYYSAPISFRLASASPLTCVQYEESAYTSAESRNLFPLGAWDTWKW